MRTCVWTISVIACLLSGQVIFAQSQSDKADLSGVVYDSSGAVVPSATTTITSSSTGLVRTASTDRLGHYRLPVLPPGVYSVRTDAPGFASIVYKEVTLTVGQTANLDITLDVKTAAEEITVTTATQMVEREKIMLASTLQTEEIENLPINGRNFLDFALLTPGATNNNPMLASITPSNSPTTGLSFTGQDPRSNYVTIDGADNMDVAVNAVRSTLSQDAVQEFQIIRNTFSAEFGRARGGIINIVSKSGSNEFRGSAFLFFRDKALDSRNAFAFGPNHTAIDPPFRRYQFGGTVGGPIAKNRTFFFGSYEGLRRRESDFVTVLEDDAIFRTTASQNRLFDFLRGTNDRSLQTMAEVLGNPAFGILNTTPLTFPKTISLLQQESGVFPFKGDSHTASVRLDHQLSNADQFFVRFNFNDLQNEGADLGALKGRSNGNSIETRNYTLVGSETHIFSSATLNVAKFQVGRFRTSVLPNDRVGPEIIIAGVARIGRDFVNPTGYHWNIFQFADDLNAIRSRHNLKAGINANFMRAGGFAEVFTGGQFTFAEAIPLAAVLDTVFGQNTTTSLAGRLAAPASVGGFGRPDLIADLTTPVTSLQSFNLGIPIIYLQGFGNSYTSFNYPQLALYFQDIWRVGNNLTLNLGARYDTDWQASAIVPTSTPPFNLQRKVPKDHNDLAPRFGFSLDPFGTHKTAIRGGYGIAFQNALQTPIYISRVLSGQISQVFLPLTGIPGIAATPIDIWGFYQTRRKVGLDALAAFNVNPGTTPSVLLTSSENNVHPYSQQASFGGERELSRDLSISLDYSMNRGVHLIRARDINVRRLGPNRFGLPGLDPRYVQLNAIETSGSSIYHGFEAELKKRYRRNFEMSVGYTLGKDIDDVSDFTLETQPYDHTNLRAERSLSAFDQRHRFVASGLVQSGDWLSNTQGFPKKIVEDWTIAPIITWASGRPFTLLAGYDVNGDTHADDDRPTLVNGGDVGRNTGEGPGFFTTDLRVARKFSLQREATRVEFIFEAFNLFNNVNYSGVNNVVGNFPLQDARVHGRRGAAANQPLGFTSAYASRQLQLALRFSF